MRPSLFSLLVMSQSILIFFSISIAGYAQGTQIEQSTKKNKEKKVLKKKKKNSKDLSEPSRLFGLRVEPFELIVGTVSGGAEIRVHPQLTIGGFGTYVKKDSESYLTSGLGGGASVTYWILDKGVFKDGWLIRTSGGSAQYLIRDKSGSYEDLTIFTFFGHIVAGYAWFWKPGIFVETLGGLGYLMADIKAPGYKNADPSGLQYKFNINLGWSF